MTDIRHQITVEGTPRAVYQALSTIDGLSGWWTKTTSGKSTLDDEIDFRFGEHLCVMRVDALDADRAVGWECKAAGPDWVGTKVRFELDETSRGTRVRFAHSGWREANDFFAHCSTKWATFMLSLKRYVETGTGAPFPDDVQI